MESLKNIELYPVLYFCPGDFDELIYPFKGKATVEQQYQYWKEVLTKNGYPNLEPIEKGLHHVKASDFDDESMSRQLAYFEIGQHPIDDEDLAYSSVAGGVIMMTDNKIIVEPQCCVSLEDYKEWTRIKPTETFERIWLGHPWMYYKTNEDTIFLTRLIEKDAFSDDWIHHTFPNNRKIYDDSTCFKKPAKEITDEDILYSISLEDMNIAIKKLQDRVDALKNRYEKKLRELGVPHAAIYADYLVNGDGKFPSYGVDDAE